jgi:hypothetical protein
MARPEGVEPPTPRSVVRSNPQSEGPRERTTQRSALSWLRSFRLNIACFISVWKQVGNIIALESGRSLAPRRALTDNKKAPITFIDYPDRCCVIPSPNPQICILRLVNSVSHSADLNDAVSRLFPSSPGIVGDVQSRSLAQFHAGSILLSSIRLHQRQAQRLCRRLDDCLSPAPFAFPKKAGGRGEREAQWGRNPLLILTSHKKESTYHERNNFQKVFQANGKAKAKR